jgi:uncharacterized membrane protein YhhN
MTSFILVAAIASLVLLLAAEKRDSLTGRLIFKPLLSSLFIAAALLQPRPDVTFALWVLAGLSLSWVGDVLLIFKSRAPFLMGLIAFLLGHVCYVLAFYRLGQWGVWSAFVLVVLAAAGILVFRWLSPGLNGMRGPVAAYMVVITAMVVAAMGVGAAPDVPAAGRWIVPAGAIAFYLSDISVARDQFMAREFINRWIGLPLYYLGQFLLAFSIGRVAV